MTKIFIAEEIPSLNKGEAAILFGMLESFRSIEDDAEVSLLSFHPEIDKPRYSDRVKVIDGIRDLHLINGFDRSIIVRLLGSMLVIPQYLSFIMLYKMVGSNALKIMKKEIWKEYCELDLMIIAHDSVFAGLFGQVPFLQLYNLLLAKILKIPIVFYAGSIGGRKPFKSILQRSMAKFILNGIDLITLRDETSYKYLKTLGCNTNHAHVTADVAYLMHAAPFDRVKEIMSQESIDKNNGPIIGITVTREMCHLTFSDIEDLEEKYQKSIMLLSQVIDYSVDTLNAKVIFIPHCIGPGKGLDDRIVANDICQLVKNTHRVKVISKEYTPEELKGLVGQFDLFIGERLHSVVGSISMGVPSLALLYPSPRNGIIKGVVDKKWIYNIEAIDFNLLISAMNEIWSEKEEIKKDLINKVEVVRGRALLNGELLKNILKRYKR